MSLPQDSSQLLQTHPNPENLCRNDCGFHGNPEWNGYCSKCYRELVVRMGTEAITESLRAASPRGSDGVSKGRAETMAVDRPASLQFAKFESKKKAQAMTRKAKVSQFFKRGTKSTDLIEGSSDFNPKENSENAKFAYDFNNFLKTLKKPAAQDIVAQLKKFINDIATHSPRPIRDNQVATKKFYSEMFQRLQLLTPFKGMSEDQLDTAMDCIEKYVMTRLHGLLFCPSGTDDEQRDRSLQLTMKKLRWLKMSHLGVDINLESMSHDLQQSVKSAQKELVTIDTKHSPQEKLQSVVKCSKHIFEVLYVWNNGPVGVDQYLPTLIYVIVQAIPPRLHSNIEYIQRFANPVRLSSGESSYYFTNLCGAVSFIESISAEALHMTQDEFDGYVASNELLESSEDSFADMTETDGDPLTVMKIELEKCGLDLPTDEELMPSDDDLLVPDVEQFEPLKIMRSSNQAMIELSKKLEELRNRALALQDEVEAFRQSLAAEVAKILNYKKEPSQRKLEEIPQPIASEV